MVVARSAFASADFTIDNLDDVKVMDGVQLLLTAADLTEYGDLPCEALRKQKDGSEMNAADIPLLAKGRACHVGDALAIVIADTEQQAADAAEALDVTYSNVPVAAETATAASNTYAEDDLIGAAEGVFGKGAKGIAKMIEGLLAKEGQPNGYIVGREAGGAFIFGARYGSGTLHHKVEGERKVYWNGPSVGFDAGANAANTFVLVYNLWDSEDLFKRYPAGEGQAYLVGGLHASYVRRGDVVLIPIRMGTGLRLGVNAGYMKFSKKQRWLPF